MEMSSVSSDDHLQILTDRSRDLIGKMSEIIDGDGFSFCCRCSNHGRYCVVASNTLDEREKQQMMAIRDCVHDFHTLLVSLQAGESIQKKQRDEALSRLQESRIRLTDRISRCSERERKLEVLEELISFLQHWNFEDKAADERTNANRVSSFLVDATKFAFEFVVAFAGIYSAVRFCNNRHHRKHPVESTSTNDYSHGIYLHVLSGRG